MPHNMTVAEEDHEDLHHGDLESLELDVDVLRGDEGDEEAHGSEDEVEDFTLAEKFSGIALGRDLLQEHRCYDKYAPHASTAHSPVVNSCSKQRSPDSPAFTVLRNALPHSGPTIALATA